MMHKQKTFICQYNNAQAHKALKVDQWYDDNGVNRAQYRYNQQ